MGLSGKIKNIVVSGATSGIGLEVAREFLLQGNRVISCARNMEKALIVRNDLIKDTSNENFVFYYCDFEDFKSVSRFADLLKNDFDSIDVLINNAATWEMSFNETNDGIERNLQVNHLSPMLLSLLLIPLLQKAENARIVNTSSGAHRRDILNLKDLEYRHTTYDGIATYSQSKLLNILFGVQLEKILKDTGITVNTVHPGYVKTALFNKMGKRSWEGVADAKYGAQSAVFAALSPEMQNISGRYIYLDKEDYNLSEKAKNKHLASEIWNISLEYIKEYLTNDEGLIYTNS
jgi:NAD(P)-dependent dehydrogenase (short-subunit alcohol dehydrogenase family)